MISVYQLKSCCHNLIWHYSAIYPDHKPWTNVAIYPKVNRDRENIDAPGCKKKAYMGLDFRTLNGSEI